MKKCWWLLIIPIFYGCDSDTCDFFLGNVCESSEEEESSITEDRFQFPLDEYVVTLGFGEWHPDYWENDPAGLYHAAEDIACSGGTPVYAIADGKIDYSGAWGNQGDAVIAIDHYNPNIYSLYGHLSLSMWYKKDGDVKKGELIGYINGWEGGGHPCPAGACSYEHLHFAIRTGNVIDYYGYSEWEWRILGGHTVGNPTDVGWLHPSNFINEQNQLTNPL